MWDSLAFSFKEIIYGETDNKSRANEASALEKGIQARHSDSSRHHGRLTTSKGCLTNERRLASKSRPTSKCCFANSGCLTSNSCSTSRNCFAVSDCCAKF